MDGLAPIAAVSGNASYPPTASTQPGVAAAAPAGGAVSPVSDALSSPAIDDAPSPTPEAILADTKKLPANVRYAPSSVPRDAARTKFDRSA